MDWSVEKEANFVARNIESYEAVGREVGDPAALSAEAARAQADHTRADLIQFWRDPPPGGPIA